ncbi:FMN-binding protein [Nitrospinaceae bacterium]|nr:FMN-binding protein [Nitrospinaceae bacterium]
MFIPFRSRNFYLTFSFSLVSFVFLSTFAFAEEEKKFQLQVYLTKKQAFEIAFPGADEIKKERLWLTKEEIRAIEEIYMYKIYETRFTFYTGIKNGKPMGSMLIDNIIGKSFPITFMTVLNTDGTVRDVEIMVYREPQGWEVRYKSFRSQFYGKDTSSNPNEILSISGATLSVRAIKIGVYKAMAAYKVLYLDK